MRHASPINTAAAVQIVLCHSRARRLHQTVRTRLANLASGAWPPCPVDVRMVGRALSFVLAGRPA